MIRLGYIFKSLYLSFMNLYLVNNHFDFKKNNTQKDYPFSDSNSFFIFALTLRFAFVCSSILYNKLLLVYIFIQFLKFFYLSLFHSFFIYLSNHVLI